MKSDELKLRIMLLNGEEVESQSAGNAGDGGVEGAAGGIVSGADEDSSNDEDDGAEEEEINEEDVERNRGRDRINNRNKLLYGDSGGGGGNDDGEEDEVDVFEALKRRREQYLARTAAPPIETDSDEGRAPAKLNSNNGDNRAIGGRGAPEIEYEVGDGGDTESLRLRLDDLEDSEDNDVVDDDDLRNNRHHHDGDVVVRTEAVDKEEEKENIDGINMTLTSGMRRKKQQIIDSESEDDETIQTDRFDALKGDTLAEGVGPASPRGRRRRLSGERGIGEDDNSSQDVVTQRRASKKRERSENDSADSDQGDEGSSGAKGKPTGSETQMKAKRKRIVIADDDDDED